jgi:predicted RNase H-like HicB family nuclease
MHYRVGNPFWRAAARAGMPLSFRVCVRKDQDSQTYWAESPDLDGLVVSGNTLDELKSEVQSAASLLLEMEVDGANQHANADFRFSSPLAA